MSALIDKLFTKPQADAIRHLWEDKNSRLLIEQEIGKQIIQHDDIIHELPLTQIMFITAMSPFASSSNECHNVAEIIYWGINRTDILPYISEHQGKELAYRCLISLGLFKKALNYRCNRRGAPSPDFYRNIGISCFAQIGEEDISEHFAQWEGFLGEMFI